VPFDKVKPNSPVMIPDPLQQHLQALFGAAGHVVTLTELPLDLLLLNEQQCASPFSPEQVDTIWQNMPYWAFVWSSGAALARYVSDHPEAVAGKRIVDFGAGSGVVGLAALKAGASSVCLCDIDPLALQAGQFNAELNGVSVTTALSLDEVGEFDLLLVGDILYDTRNHDLANTLFTQGKPLLWAESRAQTKLSHHGPIAHYAAETQPNIGGFDEHTQIHIYQHQPV